MLKKPSETSIKSALSHVAKIPFAKKLLHKINEAARGKCIAFFSIHRVLENDSNSQNHPHFRNNTALTANSLDRFFKHIKKTLNFIDINEAIEHLKGNKLLPRSGAVVVLEVPYATSVQLVESVAAKHKIPFSIVLSSESIESGQMPWTDEIVFGVFSSPKQEVSFSFIDRTFSLTSDAHKIECCEHLLENVSRCSGTLIKERLEAITRALDVVGPLPARERLLTTAELQTLGNNPSISFGYASAHRFPLHDATLPSTQEEIIEGIRKLMSTFNRKMVPAFFFPSRYDISKNIAFSELLMNMHMEAAFITAKGICRPGDNMFELPLLPLAHDTKSFERFELQGLSHAIDEFLLVTMAKEKEL